MTPEEAIERLRGRPVVAAARSSLPRIKELHATCLRNAIPAAMHRPAEPGG